jgi:glycosyltransferase involved in cell wall biosynthesis
MKNIKYIWFISKYAITPAYGNASRQYFLSKYLAKKGFDVTLISSQSSNVKLYKEFKGFFQLEEDSNMKHFLLKGPKITLGFSLLRLWSWILFEWYVLRLALPGNQIKKPDVVIVSSLSLLTFCSGILLKWRYKTKLIIEVRDIWPLTLIEIGRYNKLNPIIIILRFIEKLGYASAEVIVGTMPNLKEHIRNSIKKKVPVYFVPQGYDNEISIKALTPASQEKLNQTKSEKFRIIYAGNIGKANKIDLLLDVAAQLMSKKMMVHFYFLGDGPLKIKYKKESAALNNVTFIDSIPSSEISLFLSNFDLLVCPIGNKSIYRFGVSPNKVVDYMCSGRPILFSYNGYPSFVDADKYSFITEAENSKLLTLKIIEIMGIDKQVLNKMGASGIDVVKNNHSFDCLSEKYINIINSI